MYWIWRRRTNGIGDVEPLVVDKILRRYIGIVGEDSFLVDILKFFGGNR